MDRQKRIKNKQPHDLQYYFDTYRWHMNDCEWKVFEIYKKFKKNERNGQYIEIYRSGFWSSSTDEIWSSYVFQ